MRGNAAKVNALKDCDVRGTYPEEVYEELFQAAGYGFAKSVLERAGNENDGGVIVLAGDARVSTPSLKQYALKGIVGHPVQVVDLGVVPTNIAYWAKEKLRASGVAIITASHNPPNFNGLKMMNGDLPPSPDEIHSLARFIGKKNRQNKHSEVRFWPDAVEEYKKELTEQFRDCIKGMKVVIDAGNGCLSNIASDVYRKVGAEVIAINDERDGTFPGRLPDCAVPEHLGDLVEAVKNHEADIGIAFDGDGDRIAVVDDCGRVLKTEYIGMMLVMDRLKKNPFEKVVVDVKCSTKLEYVIAKMTGVPIRCKSGHSFMKHKVLTTGANMGIELSGHIFYKELNGRDDPLYSSLLIASITKESGTKLSERVDAFPQIYTTNDIRLDLPVGRISEIITKSRTSFTDAMVELTDGTKVVYENGWVLARRSITEPKITIRMEGNTARDLRAIAQRFTYEFKDLAESIQKEVENTLRIGRI